MYEDAEDKIEKVQEKMEAAKLGISEKILIGKWYGAKGSNDFKCRIGEKV